MTADAYLDELTRLEDDARALVSGLGDAQGNWQPDAGRRWSIIQNLEHLAKTNQVYVRAMRDGLARAPRGETPAEDLSAIPGWFGRWFISIMEPPPRFRVKTRAIVQPPSTGTVERALADFVASHEAVRSFAREAAAHGLRAKFTSPFGPVRFAVGTGLLILLAHDRRHLWQARQVLQAAGFPR